MVYSGLALRGYTKERERYSQLHSNLEIMPPTTSGCNKQPDTQRLKALCMEIINTSTRKKENTEQNFVQYIIATNQDII